MRVSFAATRMLVTSHCVCRARTKATSLADLVGFSSEQDCFVQNSANTVISSRITLLDPQAESAISSTAMAYMPATSQPQTRCLQPRSAAGFGVPMWATAGRCYVAMALLLSFLDFSRCSGFRMVFALCSCDDASRRERPHQHFGT